jgi:hypothetical protein
MLEDADRTKTRKRMTTIEDLAAIKLSTTVIKAVS